MDLQTDLAWIQKELQEVKDLNFIAAIKSMLEYRKEALLSSQATETALINEAEIDIKEGRIYSIEEAHKVIDDWKL